MSEGPPHPTIRRATPEDAPAVLALVGESRLPLQGLEDLADTLGKGRPGVLADVEGVVIGCALIEPYGRTGLLRSVAVDAAWRGRGVGESLVDAANALAVEAGLTELVLLTETAAPFFARLGFDAIPRSDVPESVRVSGEFTSVCPASAQAMTRPATAGPSRREP